MQVEIPKAKYTGSIKAIEVKGKKGFTVGGETAYPFYTFEGEMPHKPLIAIEINDIPPTEWSEELKAVWGDVFNDPAAWAKKAQDEFGADLIHLELVGSDPNGANRSVAELVDTVKKVADAIEVPLAVWGCANQPRDAEVLRAVCEGVTDKQLLIGPVQDENYKQIGAGVMAYNHYAIASSPIDINLAKQLNILLGNLGVAESKILMDPTVGGLGYGLEYSYSVMERARMAALAQQDEKLQFPMYCNLGREVWKTKEAKLSVDDAHDLGDEHVRGVMMESITASACLVAGGDILVLRHPRTIELIRNLIEDLTTDDPKPRMFDKPVAFADVKYKPEPKVLPEIEVKEEAPKKEAPKAAEKPAPKKDDKAEAAAKAKAEAEAKAKAEAEAKAKAEAEAKAKAEAEAKAKAEAEAKAKKEAEEREKKEAEAKAKAEAEAAAKADEGAKEAVQVVQAQDSAGVAPAGQGVTFSFSVTLPASVSGGGEDAELVAAIEKLTEILSKQQADLSKLREMIG